MNEISILIKFIKDIYIINKLKTNLLVNINILNFKNVIVMTMAISRRSTCLVKKHLSC